MRLVLSKCTRKHAHKAASYDHHDLNLHKQSTSIKDSLSRPSCVICDVYAHHTRIPYIPYTRKGFIEFIQLQPKPTSAAFIQIPLCLQLRIYYDTD